MIVFVAGASTGIGCAVVKKVLAEGNTVIACARKGFIDRTKTCENNLMLLKEEYSDRLTCIEADVSNENDMQKAARMVKSKYGRIDVLVHCAGVILSRGIPLIESSVKDIENSLKINVIGPIITARCFAELLIIGEPGKIMVVLSENLYSPLNSFESISYTYKLSKMSEFAACQLLRHELAEKGIELFGVHPGRVKTQKVDYAGEIDVATCADNLYALICGEKVPDLTDGYCNYNGERMGEHR